jgi:hypothetical protein
MTHTPSIRISFDGFGFNDENSAYKERLATLSNTFRSEQVGLYIETAVNAHEEMLAALKAARRKIEMWPEGSNPEYFPEIKAIDSAIAKAERGQP